MPLIDFFHDYANDEYEGLSDVEADALRASRLADERVIAIEVERRRGWSFIDSDTFTGVHPVTGLRVQLRNWADEAEGYSGQLMDEMLGIVDMQDACAGDVTIDRYHWRGRGWDVEHPDGFRFSLSLTFEDASSRMHEKELRSVDVLTFGKAVYPSRTQAICAAWCAAFDAGWFEWFEDWPSTEKEAFVMGNPITAVAGNTATVTREAA